MRQCVSKDAGPQKGWDLVRVSHRLDKGTSANENVEHRRGVDCEIPHQLGMRTKHSL